MLPSPVQIATEIKSRKVLVACSGGKDSKTALGLLLDAQDYGDFEVVVGHVSHGIREESLQDASDLMDWVASFRRGIVFLARHLTLEKTDEGTARDARRKALLSMAREVGAQVIVTGHTAQDQVETMIMRLVRGCGLRGLGGIRPWYEENDMIFYRPLLCATQEEISEYMAQKGWVAIEDNTNHTDKYFRNRVRHHVIPKLKEENPKLEQAVYYTSLSLQEDFDALQHYAKEAFAQAFVDGQLRRSIVSNLPRAVLARVLFLFWDYYKEVENVSKNKQLTYEHVQKTIDLILQSGQHKIHWPETVVLISPSFISLTPHRRRTKRKN